MIGHFLGRVGFRIAGAQDLAIGVEQIALAVTLEDAAEVPAMAVIVGELGVLVAVVHVIDVAQKLDVGPQAARARAFRIAFENLVDFGGGRIALLFVFLLIFLVAHPRWARRRVVGAGP